MAVFRDERDPGADGIGRPSEANPLPVQVYLACINPVETEDCPGNLGTAGADEPRKPDDLSSVHLQGDVPEDTVLRQASCLEHDRPGTRVPGLVAGRDFSSHHLPHDLGRGQFADGCGPDGSSVANHCHAICDVEHFAEPVIDDEDRRALSLEVSDEDEQALHLMRCQGRGRLV